MANRSLHPATRAAHATRSAWQSTSTPLISPLYQTSVYAFDTMDDVEASYTGEKPSYLYYRNGSPNTLGFERAVAQLEDAEAAITTSSGMAMITAAILTVAGAGDHLIADRHAYGGTYALLMSELPCLGIETTLVDSADPAAVTAAFRPQTKAVLLESLSNPTLRVADLPGLIALARDRDVPVFVDNTFASPALLQPLTLGATLSWHSMAKYLSGQSQAGGGVAAGPAKLIEKIRQKVIVLGSCLGSFDAWLATLGLTTLPLRMAAHSRNALAVAHYLEGHPDVVHVDYPGLPSHPQHTLARELFHAGYGGMITFTLRGGRPAVGKLVAGLELIVYAPSLADVTTTLSYPAGTSHRNLPPEVRTALGIHDGTIRLSVGIEDQDDILADLANGLSSAHQLIRNLP